MPQNIWSRLLRISRSAFAAPRVRRAPLRMGGLPTLEVLEDRLTPSGGGHGGVVITTGLGGSGKGGSGSLPPAQSAPAPVGFTGRAFKLDDTTAPPTSAGVLLNELFSGYPLPPSVGPGLKGSALVLSDPSAWPFSMGQSNIALVPVLLTASPSTASSSAPSTASSYTLVLLNPANGMTYNIPVSVVASPAGLPGQ